MDISAGPLGGGDWLVCLHLAKLASDKGGGSGGGVYPDLISSALLRAKSDAATPADWELFQRVARVAVRRMGIPDNAVEDLVQSTMMRIVRALPNYEVPEGGRGGLTWIQTIASNLSRNWYRSHSRRRTASLSAEEGEQMDVPDTRILPPEDRMQSEEDLARVQAAIAQLIPTQAEALRLRMQDLSYEEIGTTMGISTTAVKSLLSRARTNLKALLSGDPDLSGETE